MCAWGDRPAESCPTVEGYRILAPLGVGGFAQVYRALRQDGHEVALKVAGADRRSHIEALRWEAQVLRAIGPPTVPWVYEHRDERGQSILALELLLGRTWAETLAQRQDRISVTEAISLGLRLLAVLEAVHQAGYVHADLKPQNIFLPAAPLEGMRLIDFGNARRWKVPNSTGGAGHEIVGTAQYLSPEAVDGQALDVRADLYAVGILLYEMMTGRPPFWGSDGEVKEAHRTRRPARPSLSAPMPQALEQLILKCLEKSPQARYATAADLSSALASVSVSSEMSAASRSDAATTGRPAREKQTVALLYVVSDDEPTVLKKCLAAFAGEVAHNSLEGLVAVFTSQSSDKPIQRAQRAAEALMFKRLARHVTLDLASVTVKGQGPSRRFSSPGFSKKDHYPNPEDPEAILLTSAAVSALGLTAPIPVPSHPGLFVAGSPAATEVVTAVAPLVGREPELERLLTAMIASFRSQQTCILTVLGEPGLGKSHLGTALLNQCPGDVRVLRLAASEPSGGLSEPLFRHLLTVALALPTEAPRDGGKALLMERLGPQSGMHAWPGVALAMGWVTATAPELQSLAVAPGVLQGRASRALGLQLRALARRQPLLLLLDDAQWADDATLDAIEFATLSDARVPLCVITLARPMFERQRKEWATRAFEGVLVRLAALAPDRAEAVCRHLLLPAEHIPAPVIAKLIERTGGVPLLMVELVRALKALGMVRKNEGQDSWYIATDELEKAPDIPLVDWLASRELDALPPALGAHARLCALLGKVSDGEVRGMLDALVQDGQGDCFPLDAAAGNAKLLSQGLLVKTPDGRFDFRHALVREAVARNVPAALRDPVHQSAFKYYGQPSFREDADLHLKFAYHASQSGHRVEAFEAYLQLAERSRNRHAYVAAEVMYSRALEYARVTELQEQMTATQGRGLMRYRVGRYADANKDFATALECARQLKNPVNALEILLESATALDWAHDYDGSAKLTDEASELAKSVSAERLAAKLTLGRARTAVRRGQHQEALELLARAAELASGDGDAGYETLVIALMLQGALSSSMGRVEAARDALERVVPLVTEKGDSLHLASALINRSVLWAALHKKEHLIDDCRRALQIARENGNSTLEAFCHYNLAENLARFGELVLAEQHARQLVALERKRDGDARVCCKLLLARVLALTPRQAPSVRQTVEALQSALEHLRASGDQTLAFAVDDQVFLTVLDLYTREATLGEWEEVMRLAYRSVNTLELLDIFELHALAALRRDDVASAIGAYEKALALVAKQPSPISVRLEMGLRNARAARDAAADLSTDTVFERP